MKLLFLFSRIIGDIDCDYIKLLKIKVGTPDDKYRPPYCSDTMKFYVIDDII